MKIKHYLYNSFLIEEGAAKVAIDPGQNLWLFKLESLIPQSEWATITHVVITHGDPDHHWQSDRVARASGAHVICGKALTRTADGKTLLVAPRGRGLTSWVPFENAHPLDAGESITLSSVRFDAVKTVHGPIAVPILGFTIRQQPGPTERVGLGSMGFRITMGGKSVLNLGDSLLQEDWAGLAPDVLMLPIGGLGNNTWTMDVAEALEAVRLISPKRVIPCHYNVPLLWIRRFAVADDQRFKQRVEQMGVECSLLGYGDELAIPP